MAARDVILIGVIIFAFAISVFIVHNMMGQVVTKIVANDVVNSSEEAVEAFGSITTKITPRFDYMVFGLFIGLILALIITGFMVGGHPIFMAIYFIFVVISVVLATVFNFVWESVTNASIFGATINSFTYTNNILTNLPIYMAIVGFIGIVVMFAKSYMVGTE